MTLSATAKEHGIYSYIPPHPKKILSLWGELPQLMSYATADVAISGNPSSPNKMREAFNEIHANGWQCLLEKNPEYLQEFLSVIVGKILSPEKESLKMIRDSLDELLPAFGRKPPIFFGEQKYSPLIRKIFQLRVEDYHVLENDNDEIETARLFETLRQGAIHIFFTDVYEELTPFLEQWNLEEGRDFADGRKILAAYSHTFD